MEENFTVGFYGQGQTLGTYSGLVEIRVSGMGAAFYTFLNDAFYFDGGLNPNGDYGIAHGLYGYDQLNVGWDDFGPAILGWQPHNIVNVIEFVDGVGAVTPGESARPPYDPDHLYDFVISVGHAPTRLSFGVSDGNYGDNFGAYYFTVDQVTANATSVPEPASLGLLGLGMTLVARRWRC